MQHLDGLIGYAIRATDGDLGKVREFYFDDLTWTIRYMVVETGNWLLGRKILISPVALGQPDWSSKTFSVNLTCEQVRNSPATDTDKPVFRQHETELNTYYQWPAYWVGGYQGVLGVTPFPLLENQILQETPVAAQKGDPHLRSTRQLHGYRIHATDGEIGHVADFVIDEDNWVVTYMVVDAGGWLFERKVLIKVGHVKSISWDDTAVHLSCSKEEIKDSPEFDPSQTILTNYDASCST